MGQTESALVGVDPSRKRLPRGVTCIAEAAATQQRLLHIPLLCGAITCVDFNTLLGEGSYGAVYAGSVDRSTCRYTSESNSRLHSLSLGCIDSGSTGTDSRQSSSGSSRQGCQYCFFDRTRQVAVKALRHSSEKQQQFFVNRFKFLQLIRLQQLLASSNLDTDPAHQNSLPDSGVHTPQNRLQLPADVFAMLSATAHQHCQPAPAAKATAAAADHSAAPAAAPPAIAASGGKAADNEHSRGFPCSCCRFLQFPSFDSLHLLQVFWSVRMQSGVSRVPRDGAAVWPHTF